MSENPTISHPILDMVISRGVSDLCDRPRLISPIVAKPIIARVAHESYRFGHHDAIRELVTTEDAAAAIGINRSSLSRLATRYDIGWRISPRVWLFAPEDVARLRGLSTGTAGRPRKPAL